MHIFYATLTLDILFEFHPGVSCNIEADSILGFLKFDDSGNYDNCKEWFAARDNCDGFLLVRAAHLVCLWMKTAEEGFRPQQLANGYSRKKSSNDNDDVLLVSINTKCRG